MKTGQSRSGDVKSDARGATTYQTPPADPDLLAILATCPRALLPQIKAVVEAMIRSAREGR